MNSTLSLSLNKSALIFFKNAWGIFHHPYKTMRQILWEKNYGHLISIGFLCWVYFLFSGSIKYGVWENPLFFTASVGKVFNTCLITYFLISGSIYLTGKLFGGKGKFLDVLILWSFTYFPTLFWFLTTSLLYFLLPPPRTLSLQGVFFSLFYIVLTVWLFFWKGLLYFLTLRFSLRMNVWQIVRSSVVLWPLWFLYFLLLNRMGVWKIPFA